MKIIALTIVVLIALIAFGGSLASKQTGITISDVCDYRYVDPLRGSEGEKMLARACGNCHSNRTKLPWYGHLAPVSWWINGHVRDGRQALNFTEWTTYSARRQRDELEAICGVVSNGRMPPASYRVLHPESRLGARERKMICAWAASQSKLPK